MTLYKFSELSDKDKLIIREFTGLKDIEPVGFFCGRGRESPKLSNRQQLIERLKKVSKERPA